MLPCNMLLKIVNHRSIHFLTLEALNRDIGFFSVTFEENGSELRKC